jgi:phospholipase C
MFGLRGSVRGLIILSAIGTFVGCQGVGVNDTSQSLSVQFSGNGKGVVKSNPAAIGCTSNCTASFTTNTVVQLTAMPVAGSMFAGWTGACTGTATCQVSLSGSTAVTATFNALPQKQLTVTVPAGQGTVISSPSGINCPATCSANFLSGTKITLSVAPATGFAVASWTGACTGNTPTCVVTLNSNASVQVAFRFGDIRAINHIVIMAQENRSFDHYFGHLADYWQANHYPQATNGTTFDAEPVDASNVGDPPAPGQPAPTITAYPLQTVCVENPSPSWNESHGDFNHNDPTATDYKGDGFAITAGHEGTIQNPIHDVIGARVMGYYTGDILNYYYFMASSFATSDRWFSPVMSRTQPNRMYMLGGTSQGHAYPLLPTEGPLSAKMIFQVLDENGITWKDYVEPAPPPPGQPACTTPTCLFGQSYLNQFAYGTHILNDEPDKIVPASQFLVDAANGTLPEVSYIDPPSSAELDEHPSDFETNPPNIQLGAQFISSLINGLMNSPSWADSAFILTFDEGGGFYDHVSPQPAVNPDGMSPADLLPGDACTMPDGSINPSPTCNFEYTGYRVPLIVVSPFTKANYVSHTVADYTAMLKFIETRFKLPSLTARDAAQMDMTEFFDFVNAPWAVPPKPPAQLTNGPCYLDHLP